MAKTDIARTGIAGAAPVAPGNSQRAELALRAGKRVGLQATVEVTPAGLWAVAGLVSAILLSTAALVRASAAARAD